MGGTLSVRHRRFACVTGAAVKGVGLPQGRYLVTCGTEQRLRVFDLSHLLKLLPTTDSVIDTNTATAIAPANTIADSSVATMHTLHCLSAGNTTTTSKNIFVADADWKSDLAAMQPLLTQWVSASDASAIAVRTAGQD